MEWRVIAESPDYEISENGDVRRHIKSTNGHPPKQLKLRIQRDGYLTATLAIEGKLKTRFAHKLVALAFIGSKPSPSHQVAHCDGSRTNNHFSNLRWATPKENQFDRWKHGTRAFGARSHLSRLTEAGVADIRARFAAGEKSISELAEIHGVAKLTITDIVRNRSWLPQKQAENAHSPTSN